MTTKDNKTLHLVLKRKWWDMIASGVKTEEYREIKHHWIKLLCYQNKQEGCKHSASCEACLYCALESGEYMCYPYDYVCFHLGYTKTTMTFEVKDIFFGKGKPEWGAPSEDVFIIKLGKRT